MREKLRTEAGRTVYKMRKAIVEPVFGQIKEQRGFRRFSLRGKENVSREWKLVCAASNLLKLFRAGGVPEMAQNGPGKGPAVPKTAQKACYKLPTGLLLRRAPQVEHQPCKPMNRPWQTLYLPHT